MVVIKCKYLDNGFRYKYKDNQIKETKINYLPLKYFSLLIKLFNEIK